MKKLIQELALLWPGYLKNKTENSKERAYQIIYDDLPKALKVWNSGISYLTEKSSGGTGNVTAGPWFATFDNRITDEPQKGYYLVFLFSVDMKNIVLELGFATKQFKDFYGDSKQSRGIMRKSAITMQNSVESVLKAFPDQSFINKLSLDESDLSTKGNNKYKLQVGYEKASIFNISYNIDQLEGKDLKADYLNFIALYQGMVSSSDTMGIEALFDISISIDSITKIISPPKAKPFIPRTPSKVVTHTVSKGVFKGRGLNESTKKIGDLGESIVMASERQKLIDAGLEHLAVQIVHEEAENNRPGWDISSFDELGEPIQIEVKASKGKAIRGVIITENELKAAKRLGSSYHIYLVSGVSGSKPPEIEVIKDPAKDIDSGCFQLTPAAYDLKLYS